MAKVTRPATSGVISAPEVGQSRSGPSSKKSAEKPESSGTSSRGSERLRVTNSTVPSLNRLKRMVPSNQSCMVFPNHELDQEIKSFVDQQNAKHPLVQPSRTGSTGSTSTGSSSSSRLTGDSTGNSSHSSAKINPALLGHVTPHMPPTQLPHPHFFGHVTPHHHHHHVATSGTCVPNAARPHVTSTNPKSNPKTNPKHTNASKNSEKSAESSKSNKRLPGPSNPSAKNPKNSKSAEEKAYIDSFMQHEPGIFSGTFSGNFIDFGQKFRKIIKMLQISKGVNSRHNK